MKKQQMHEVIKQRGLDSVKQVCEIVDCSPQTLKNWYLKKPKLFEVVIVGSNCLKKHIKCAGG